MGRRACSAHNAVLKSIILGLQDRPQGLAWQISNITSLVLVLLSLPRRLSSLLSKVRHSTSNLEPPMFKTTFGLSILIEKMTR